MLTVKEHIMQLDKATYARLLAVTERHFYWLKKFGDISAFSSRSAHIGTAAEDLVAEALLSIMAGDRRCTDQPISESAFIKFVVFDVIKSHAFHLYQRIKHFTPCSLNDEDQPTDTLPELSTPDTAEVVAWASMDKAIREILAHHRQPRLRKLFELSVDDGLNKSEIAQAMGVSNATISNDFVCLRNLVVNFLIQQNHNQSRSGH
ncbi:MAG: hypothetical protein KTR20_08055 [Cellvibrionaceae bacterium]|nr:hypothetical protein [Cellvibrionaceae bacterium]